MTTSILVGVDGSDESARALRWCADIASRLSSEVIVVHVIGFPVFPEQSPTGIARPTLSVDEREQLRSKIVREWCDVLADAGVKYRVELMGGYPPDALLEAAQAEDADIVVTGRRGRGGLAEVLLGSTSRKLTHHCDRPLVIIP